MTEEQQISDADLLRRVRGADLEAMGVLYERHKEAALRVARAVSGDPHLAQDLVSSAFERIHAALVRGHGPEESFRAYLYTVIRRLAAEAGQAKSREEDVDDWEPYASVVALADHTDGSVEARLVATAFSALPERHQAVLWYLDVEGMSPSQAAPYFELSPNAVSALAIRARDGLRDAYVQAHVADSPVHADCAPVRRQLGAYLRSNLSARDTAKVEAHLAVCDECPVVLTELRDVTGGLRSALGPIMLGGAAATGLVAVGAGAQTAHAATAAATEPASRGAAVSGIIEKIVIGLVAALAVAAVGSAIVNITTLPVSDLAEATAADRVIQTATPTPTPTRTPSPSRTPTATATPTPSPAPQPVPAPAPPAPAPPAPPSPSPTADPVPPEAAMFLDVVDEGDAGLGDGTRLSRIIVEVHNTSASAIDAALRLRLPGGTQVDSGRAVVADPAWACPGLALTPVECAASGVPAGERARIEVPVLTPAADVDSRPIANLRITSS